MHADESPPFFLPRCSRTKAGRSALSPATHNHSLPLSSCAAVSSLRLIRGLVALWGRLLRLLLLLLPKGVEVMIGRRGPVAKKEPQEGGRHVGGDSPLLMGDGAKVNRTRVRQLCRFSAFALGRRKRKEWRRERQNSRGGWVHEGGWGGGGGCPGARRSPSPIHLHPPAARVLAPALI